GDLRSRRGRWHQRPASVIRAVRADRLHHRLAEDADAGPHAPMAARHAARIRPAVRTVRRVHVDRAPPHASARRGTEAMNWRIRLTWWDKALLAVMAVALVIT